MNKLILFSILLFLSVDSPGQPITLIKNESEIIAPGVFRDAYSFNHLDFLPNNCQEDRLWFIPDSLPFLIPKIAYLPAGDLIMLHSTINGIIHTDFNLVKVDLQNQNISPLGRIEGLYNPVSIKAASNNTIYISDWTLKKYDISTNELIDLGMPGIDGTPVNWVAFLTFINGELYASVSASNFLFTTSIIKINLNNLTESELILETDLFKPFSMMTTIHYDCDSSLTIITVSTSPGLEAYQLDVEARSLTYMCNLPLSTVAFAHPTEAIRFDCVPILDLDELDVFGISGLDYQSDTVCITAGGEVFPLESALPAILTNTVVDSIWAGITDGAKDGADEWIGCNGASGFCSNSGKGIMFRNNTRADNETFLNNIRQSFFYKNITPAPTAGMREIAFVTFKKTYRSDTSYLQMPVLSGPDAGEDATILLCRDDAPIDLFAQLNGMPQGGGLWSPTVTSGSGWFNPQNDQSGIFQYTVPGGLCPSKTASVAVTVNELPQFSLGADLVLCSGTGAILEPNIVGENFQWQDNSSGQSLNISAGGEYWLELTDSLGCSSRDTIQVSEGIHVQKDSLARGCSGDFFTFQGSTFTADTTVCTLNRSSSGCDSTFCLNLQFMPNYEQVIRAAICPGESYRFEGKDFADAGVYEERLLTVNGCDSLLVLELDVLSPPTAIIEGDSIICYATTTELFTKNEFLSYDWSTGSNESTISVGAGKYTLTVTDEYGCTVNAVKNVRIKKCDYAYIPSAFSPNGDFVNDKFRVYTNSHVDLVTLKIFDRWGGLIFESDSDNGWDGTWQGKAMSLGVYAYLAELVLPNGEMIIEKGSVSLVR